MLHEIAEALNVGRLQIAQMLRGETFGRLVCVSLGLVVQHEALARRMRNDTGMLLVRERRVLWSLGAHRIISANGKVSYTILSAQQCTVGVLRDQPDERRRDVGHFRADLRNRSNEQR